MARVKGRRLSSCHFLPLASTFIFSCEKWTHEIRDRDSIQSIGKSISLVVRNFRLPLFMIRLSPSGQNVLVFGNFLMLENTTVIAGCFQYDERK